MEDLQYPVTKTLPVPRPWSARSSVTIRKPVEIGCYSLIGEREYVNDSRKLSYLIEPAPGSRIQWNLNLAFAKRVAKDHSVGNDIEDLLRWIRDNSQKFRASCDGEQMSSLNTDFVVFRGVLTMIMCSVYETKGNWIIGATKYRNTIYLRQYATQQKLAIEENKDEFQTRACAWGYKFEHFLTADSPDGKPTPSEGLNEKEEYCSMVRTRLSDKHSLVYGAEVDAVDPKVLAKHPELKNSTDRYVEMKTSRIIQNERQHSSFRRFKLVKWFTQSFLIGIPRVICGFRDDKGVVRKLESFSLGHMEELGAEYWSKTDLLNFLDKFLTFVKESVTNDPQDVTLFEFVPHKHMVKCMKLPAPDMEHFRVLPTWYTDHMNQHFHA